jgi:hypothetical protein
MSNLFKENMLLQTFIELDTQISKLTQHLSSNRFIEVGDDPNLVQEIEKVLLRVYIKAKGIGPFFDLKVIPLSRANIYFALIMHVNDALKYLQEVRKRDYGSRQHTRELLEILKNCEHSIYAIGNLVTENTEIIH